jgi:ribosomal protein S18 acetylase RimI-like enzyme
LDCGGFKCTNHEINKWVAKKALQEHAPGVMHVTCATPKDENRPIGIYAISTVAEEMANLPGRRYRRFRAGNHFPAMHLVWLATDHGFEDRGLGKLMVGQVIRQFADIGARIGIPHLILTPAAQDKDKLLAFYERLGFIPYADGESMHLSIEDALDAVEKARAIQNKA